MSVVYTIKGVGNAEKELKASVKRFATKKREFLKASGLKFQKNIRGEAPRGSTGALRKSIDLKVGSNELKVFSKSKIALFVNEGTKATTIHAKGGGVLAKKSGTPVRVKNARGGRSGVIPSRNGYVVFGKRVEKPTQPANPFFQRGINKTLPFIRSLIKEKFNNK